MKQLLILVFTVGGIGFMGGVLGSVSFYYYSKYQVEQARIIECLYQGNLSACNDKIK